MHNYKLRNHPPNRLICDCYLDGVPVSRLRSGAYTFSAALRAHAPGADSAIDTRFAAFLLAPENASEAKPVAAAQPEP